MHVVVLDVVMFDVIVKLALFMRETIIFRQTGILTQQTRCVQCSFLLDERLVNTRQRA